MNRPDTAAEGTDVLKDAGPFEADAEHVAGDLRREDFSTKAPYQLMALHRLKKETADLLAMVTFLNNDTVGLLRSLSDALGMHKDKVAELLRTVKAEAEATSKSAVASAIDDQRATVAAALERELVIALRVHLEKTLSESVEARNAILHQHLEDLDTSTRQFYGRVSEGFAGMIRTAEAALAELTKAITAARDANERVQQLQNMVSQAFDRDRVKRSRTGAGTMVAACIGTASMVLLGQYVLHVLKLL